MTGSAPSPERATLAQPTPAVLSSPPASSCPTVVLLHTLADGSSHFDWLLAVEPAGIERLITFRMEQRVDELSFDDDCAPLVAQSIGRHRPAYLEYEGPVSGERGEVARVRSGVIESWTVLSEREWHLSVRWRSESVDSPPVAHLLLRALDDRMMTWEVHIENSASEP